MASNHYSAYLLNIYSFYIGLSINHWLYKKRVTSNFLDNIYFFDQDFPNNKTFISQALLFIIDKLNFISDQQAIDYIQLIIKPSKKKCA